MATVYWRGGVEAVAQVAEGSIDSHDASTTYTVSIGGYDISTTGDTDVATTAANLVALLEASGHPYFAAITWTVPSGSTIRATADTAGMPFIAALTVSGGTGTVTDFSDTTACTGPHHADAVDNWSSGALPAASDDVVVDSGPSILYALAALTNALAKVEVRAAFSGVIGLEASQFATSLDGASTDDDFREYRGVYLELECDELVVGEHLGPGTPTGSTRLCLEQTKAGASTLDVVATNTSSTNDRPAVRYIAAHASADIIVRSAPGGVGVAVEAGETSTIGDVHMVDTVATTGLFVGSGVTLTSVDQVGGTSRIAAAATVSSLTCRGGVMDITGYDYTVTTLAVEGGTVTDSHENTGGAEWGTINVYGGTLDLPTATVSGSRSYTSLNLYGGRVEADWGALSGAEGISSTSGVPERRAVEITAL